MNWRIANYAGNSISTVYYKRSVTTMYLYTNSSHFLNYCFSKTCWKYKQIKFSLLPNNPKTLTHYPHCYLKTGIINFLWKDPDSKYFRLCRSCSLLQLLNSVLIAQKHPQTVNAWAWLCSDKTLLIWTLKTEFNVVFTSHKIFFVFFQPSKKYKTHS